MEPVAAIMSRDWFLQHWVLMTLLYGRELMHGHLAISRVPNPIPVFASA